MDSNIFVELKAEYEFLSRVEKRIADAILGNPQKFISCSMAQLSRETGVSQGSINNFAKRFSQGGFSALKLRVAACLSAYDKQPFAVVDPTQSVRAAMEIKAKENMAAFRSTIEINDEQALRRTVDRILAARKIEVCGVLHSGIAAMDLCYQLIQLGIPASFTRDALLCAVSAAMLEETDLLIAVSASGQTKEVIEAAEIAGKNRTPVICLTSNKYSPLAQVSDEVLMSAASGISISDRANETRLSQLLVIDTLCAYIRSVIDAQGASHYYKLRSILTSHNIQG